MDRTPTSPTPSPETGAAGRAGRKRRDDGRLAFSLGLATGAADPLDEIGSDAGRPPPLRSPEALWIELAEHLAVHIRGGETLGAARAAEVLTRRLGVGAVCFGRWPPDAPEPLVLGAAGHFSDLNQQPVRELFDRLRSAPVRQPVFELIEAGPQRVITVAALDQGGHLYGVVVGGEFPGRPHSARFLFLILRLFASRSPSDNCTSRSPTDSVLRFPPGHLPGTSAACRALYRDLAQLAGTDLPILIVGETGVGKEDVSRILHLSSGRREGPLVAVNCAAIPADLLEAEMFGVGRNVATGVAERPGKFEAANGGTLLLDEIAEMPRPLQSKLLRSLEAEAIEQVGGGERPIDVRFLGSTNVELETLLGDERMRPDLYYRLAGAVVRVPPLRERRDDLPGLIESLLLRFARNAGKTVLGVSVYAMDLLCHHDWPGNFRELEHELRRLVHVCPEGRMIDSSLLSPPLRRVSVARRSSAEQLSGPLDLRSHTDELERTLIAEALARADDNQTRAAEILGLSRNGLASKMKRLGIEIE